MGKIQIFETKHYSNRKVVEIDTCEGYTSYCMYVYGAEMPYFNVSWLHVQFCALPTVGEKVGSPWAEW